MFPSRCANHFDFEDGLGDIRINDDIDVNDSTVEEQSSYYEACFLMPEEKSSPTSITISTMTMSIKGIVKNIVPWVFHDLLVLGFMMEESNLQAMETSFRMIAQKAFNTYPPRFQSRMNRIIYRFRKQSRPEDLSFLDESFDIDETTILSKTDNLMRYVEKITS